MGDNTNILDFLLENRQYVIFVEANAEILAKNASALANTRGGTLLVGVSDDGHIVGVDEATIQIISDCLSKNISPSLPYLMNIVKKDGKKIAIVSVWEGSNKPYVTNGAFYIQSGDDIVQANPQEVIQLFEEKQAIDEGWERKPMEMATPDDIDESTLVKVKNSLAKRNEEFDGASTYDVLKAMGLVRGSRLTNACVVIMCKQPSMFLPQTRIRVSVFDGGHDNPTLLDVRLYDVSLVKAVDEIAAFVYSLYPKRVVIEEMTRLDVEPLPLVAIREGLLNACVHRQYESYQSFVAVNIFADHLEIVNSGSLMDGVTLESLKDSHRSVLRNPDIANTFYQLGYIEMAGSGTLRIIEECRKNRCEDPVWSLENDCIILTFPGIHHSIYQNEEKKPIDLSKLTTDSAVRESLKAIMEYMGGHDHVKLLELTEITGKSYPSVKRYMQLLKDACLIEYSGSLRSGGWSLKK